MSALNCATNQNRQSSKREGSIVIKLNKQNLLLSTILIGGISSFGTMQAYAQVEQLPSAEAIADETDADEIVVTGSRLRKSTFDSASIITSLDVESASRVGVTSINELVNRATVVNGARVDATFNSNAGNSNGTEAPPTGGVGSSNINLRGIGPERTLVLLNGRRLASTGVRGAPAQPDIGLIPFTLVKNVDIVTDAGSSVYGADAVGGYVNVILRDDFEGFEVSGNIVEPFESGGGNELQVGFISGASSDKGHITFGAEYFDRARLATGDRDFSSSLRDIQIDPETGEIFTTVNSGFFDSVGTTPTFDRFLCFTPGQSAGTLTAAGSNFSNCDTLSPPAGFEDLGRSNFAFDDRFNDQDERRASDLVGESERLSLLATGEYDIGLFGDDQVYFEAFYFNRQNKAIGNLEQIFPTVTAEIDEVDASGAVIGQVSNPFSPFDFDFVPIVTLDDLNQERDVELQQIRLVGGYRGAFGGEWFKKNDWRYDAYASYDRGTGFQSQVILNEAALIRSLDIVQGPGGDVQCRDDSVSDAFGFLTPANCVPVNLLAPSIYTNGEGTFSSDEEREFLTGLRTNRTAIDQYIFSAFIDGNIAKSPWGGDISLGLGYEYRLDEIESQNSLLGVNGGNAGENPLPEGNTNGRRSFNEVFGEIDIPLIQGRPGIELLNVDAAVRYTEESNYSGTTYRIRGQYKPTEWASLSAGFGTSFRAPNLREQFLADQGGGQPGQGDPCVNGSIQQTIALATDEGDSSPGLQELIAQCQAAGITFTDTDNNGFLDFTPFGDGAIVTIPTQSGGNPNLDEETSETFSIKASIDQPWFDNFGLRLSAAYYDISIEDSVQETSFNSIIGNCFFDPAFPGQTSPFCDLITRGAEPNSFIQKVDIVFVNTGEITSKGFDFDAQFDYTPFQISGSDVDLTLRGSWSIHDEQITQTDADDPATRFENVDLIGTPRHRLNIGSNWGWENVTFTTEHRFIGAQGGLNALDLDDPRLSGAQSLNTNPFIIGDPVTQELNAVGSEWLHDASITYSEDAWALTLGIANIFDNEPPLIDRDFGNQRNNAVTSSGYDLIGRRAFVSARRTF